MTRLQRNLNIGAVLLPFLAFLAAIPLLWNSYVGWTELGIFLAIYPATAFGITIGFHRMLVHRAFETYRPVKYLLAVLGSMAVEGPVIEWVSDHRKHHAHTDEEGDPHSPHVGQGNGMKGLFHAHVGWLWQQNGISDAKKYARDLLEDRGMRFINRHFIWWVALGLAIPFVAGFAIGGTLTGGLLALFWAGLVRIFYVHHITWSINSICHFFGQRRFDTDDRSTNVAWLALPTLGESWHHNHHAFPRSAQQGLRWWEFDPSWLLIRMMRRLGLVWNVVVITPERQAEKEAAQAEKEAASRPSVAA
ncbi:MAG: fatty acid desaturase [Thermoleophilaceae bacterium]